jgi:uncharacterized membrane protein
MLLRSLLKKNLKKLKPRNNSMEVLIPLGIVILVACLTVKKFSPKHWDMGVSNVKNIISKFKK